MFRKNKQKQKDGYYALSIADEFSVCGKCRHRKRKFCKKYNAPLTKWHGQHLMIGQCFWDKRFAARERSSI